MGHQKKLSSVDATQQDQASGSQDDQNGAATAFSHLSFAEVLEDLSSRFIVNLPAEELASIERICFQVEQAHWFYEDFLRPLNPSLTSFSLRRFSSYLLHTSSLTVPLIQRYISTSSSGKQNQEDLEAAFDEFMRYKTRVPVCGVVMLNKTLDKCVLVKGWKSSAAWGFPKGKINQQESERDCAVREVLEETGFDCNPLLPSASGDFMELTMREQKIRLYIVPGVDESTQFETLTRKEISRIAWFKLSDLPTWKKNRSPPQGMGGKFYLISPFIGKLKQWIHENKHNRSAVTVDGIPAEPSRMQTAAVKIEDEEDVRSDDLKALLGLGHSHGTASQSSKGQQMIQEQGDARGRQLLDLLRGNESAADADDRPKQPAVLDERERGTAALLAALNAGAGMVDEVPAHLQQSSSATLLSMLNGSAMPPLGQQAAASLLPQMSSPLLAPQAQHTSQAQSLLKLISPGDAAPSDPSADTKDKERARQRDALLSSLMASSSLHDPLPPLDDEQRRVDSFRFPYAPPPLLPSFAAVTQSHNNVLSSLQPHAANRDAQYPTVVPSPFSTFVQEQTSKAANDVTQQPSQKHNPLLALLNGNSEPAPSPEPPVPSAFSPAYPIHHQATVLSPPPPTPQSMHHFAQGGNPSFPVPPAPHQQYMAPPPPPHHRVYQPPPSAPLGLYYAGHTAS